MAGAAQAGAGPLEGRTRHLGDIAGTWCADPALDAALRAQDADLSVDVLDDGA